MKSPIITVIGIVVLAIIAGPYIQIAPAAADFPVYTAEYGLAPFRALWMPLPDGRVRRCFAQSNDGGTTWVPWFEGFYRRQDHQTNRRVT